MDQQRWRDCLSGKRRGPWPAMLRGGLSAASVPWSLLMRWRREGYGRGWFKQFSGAMPVVCVGNLTTGGTGKTPMVAWVVRTLQAAGRSPAILTRGYKSAGGLADEAELLKAQCGVPVIVGRDRLASTYRAAEAGADVAVMDDGFQHLRLRRDLDIVLIDATEPFGFGRVLPRGLLREPLSALAAAGAVIITRSDAIDPDALLGLRGQLMSLAPSAIHCLAAHEPSAIIDERGQSHPPSALAGRKVLAFCGLGNPSAFFSTLRSLGADVAGELAFDDHAVYDVAALGRIAAAASACGAGLAVTTQKDHVKLARDAGAMTGSSAWPCELPLWQLAVQMRITDGEDLLIERITQAAGVGGKDTTDPPENEVVG